MFQQLTVHIGHQKTGTTSLQETFRINSRKLAKAGLFYWSGHGAHHPLAKSHNPRTANTTNRHTTQRFLKAARRSRVPRGLISSEIFVNLTGDDVAQFAKTIGPLAQDIEIVMYVRHPVATVASRVHQGLRMGRRLEDAHAMASVVPLDRIIPRWQRVFGDDRVHVRPFDRAALRDGDVVTDMMHHLGLAHLAFAPLHLNEGFSVVGAHALDRAVAKEGGKLSKHARAHFEAMEGPRYVPPQRVLDDAAVLGAAQLAYLDEAFGITLPTPKLTPSGPPTLDDAALDALAAEAMRAPTTRNVLGRLMAPLRR
ncbi:MAG: hypothetical protein AAF318_05120 [Pseudomonadota bacterium]